MNNQTCPSISVIIPTYNAESTLIAAVESVIAQTFSVSQIIIVNDGSTDKTASIADFLVQKYKTMLEIIVITVKNGGVAQARNIGITRAWGEFLAFLDSDDAWFPEKTAKQLDVFNEFPEAGLVCSASTVHKVRSAEKKFTITFYSLMLKNSIVTSSVIVKLGALPNPVFNENLQRSEDYNLWIRLAKNHAIYKINETLVQFAQKNSFGASGLSKNIHAFECDELRSFTDLWRTKVISFPYFLVAVVFSLLKYIRRCFILLTKKVI